MNPTPATGTTPVTIHQTVRRYLTASDVAASLQISTETVHRQFAGRPGVLDLGTPETKHKRRKRMLRIPESEFLRYVAEREVKARR